MMEPGGIKMEKPYDLVIAGSGPAGLSAAIYARRARLHTLVLEKSEMGGGQVLTTYEVDNYPGFPGISGFDLGVKMQEHAEELGIEITKDTVLKIQDGRPYKTVFCENETYRTRTVILAGGAKHRRLNVPGEKRLTGMGVSYCATCDGAFFRNRITAVVGGGDAAVEDAVFLARICKKVYLIHRRDTLKGAKSLQEKLFSLDNVELVWNTAVTEICGELFVTGIVTENRETGERREIPLQGVFIAVGILPETENFRGLVEMDEGGYIFADEDGRTSAPGIFAAGDIRTKNLRQIVTAVSDGANAVNSAEQYLNSL